MISSKNTTIESNTLQNNLKGQIQATQPGYIITKDHLHNKGFIGNQSQASTWTIISQNILTNDRELHAGKITAKAQHLINNQLIEGRSSLNLSGRILDNKGSLVSLKGLGLSEFSQVNNLGGIKANNIVNLLNLGDINNQAVIDCGKGVLNVEVRSFTTDSVIQARIAFMDVKQQLLARNLITPDNLLWIKAGHFINDTTLSGRQIDITTHELFENNKSILAGDHLTLNLTGISVNTGALTQGGSVTITSHGTFINRQDILSQESLIIEGSSNFENEADLKAATVSIQNFDIIKNCGIVSGAQHCDMSFKQLLWNEASIQGRGRIQSAQGEIVNLEEIDHLTIKVHGLQNKKPGSIVSSAITVSQGMNKGTIHAGTFSANGEEGFHNKNQMFLERLSGTGHFRNHTYLKLLQRGQEPNRIDIHSFLNDADETLGLIAEVTGAVIDVSSGTKSFILGQRGKFTTRTLNLKGGIGTYQNDGELTAISLTLSQMESAFVNNHLITMDEISIEQGSQMASHGDAQVGLITGEGTFHNHNRLHLIKLIEGQDSGESNLRYC